MSPSKGERRLALNPKQRRRVFEALADALRKGFDLDDVGELRLPLLLDSLEQPLAKLC